MVFAPSRNSVLFRKETSNLGIQNKLILFQQNAKPKGAIDLQYMNVKWDGATQITLEKGESFQKDLLAYTLIADTIDQAKEWAKALYRESIVGGSR
jgi:hypothetical protein